MCRCSCSCYRIFYHRIIDCILDLSNQYNSTGMRKAYWITCNVEPDIQQLSLDRRRLPNSFVVRPRDLNRLLTNFQATLQEITVIATDATSLPGDAAPEIGGKAVELRSYIDPTKGMFCYYLLYISSL